MDTVADPRIWATNLDIEYAWALVGECIHGLWVLPEVRGLMGAEAPVVCGPWPVL